ncbi:MAG TPA: hypothetical protein ENK88_03110, partial [Campylobacterales bacterium]|nr:hypothetical protein [Campylobacterales bacterium]
MINIFKQIIFLWIAIFSNLVLADGVDTQITITDASVVHEYDDHISFTIQLSEAPGFGSVTVNYSTADGSAKAGSDYTATAGSVTFYLWQTSKTIDVPIINDTIHENSESLYMNISNSDTGYVVSDAQGVGTIYDDDLAPLEAKVYNRYEKEKDSNWTLRFTVKLNQNATSNIDLNYTTQDNTAIAGEDYIKSSGTITIPKNSKYGYIPITIIGDTIPENTENFKIKISSISKGKITRSTATGKIKNDDKIKLYIKSHSTKEGNIGDNNKMPFTLYLKKAYPLDTPLKINYQTIDGSNPKATKNIDYKSKKGTVTFNKGDIKKIVNIDIIGDNEIEDNEYIKMKIWGSSYIKRSSTQSKIINDDGSFPKLYANSYNFYITEGNNSSKELNFNFKLNKPAIKDSYFDYFTQDSTAKTSDKDYKSIKTKRYKFKGGEKTINIPVKIYGDKKIEKDEIFYLKFKNNTKIRLVKNYVKGHIINDDGSFPKIIVNSSYSINEGDSGNRDLNFTMNLDKPAFKNSSFRYYTKDKSAKISDNDYIAIKPKKYKFNGGETKIIIPIKINGDKKIESNEEFYLYIDTANNITISNTHNPLGKILNDDGSYPRISFEQPTYSIIEGDSGEKELNITLTLDAPAFANTHIDYYTQDNTAQDGSTPTEDSDYIATSGTLDIDANATTASIIVKINGDTNIEPNDSFYLYINNPKNLIINSNRTEVIIKNDDIHNEEPFTCDEHMYLSSSIKRGSQITGRMWLHRIDTTKSPFGFEVMDDAGEDKLYNALAYSEIDNYIYGLYHKELFKISKTGKVVSLGEVTRLPDLLNNKQAYAGASYDGYYFVTGFGVDYDKIFKIKLSDSDANRTVTDINLSTAVSIKDFSFSPHGQYLYGIADGGKLTKIDVNDGNVTFIGEPHTGYEFDSSFSDKNGRFFANDSKGHGFFEFNLQTGTKRFLSDSQPADYNDGTNCLNAGLVFTDYGDAPIN